MTIDKDAVANACKAEAVRRELVRDDAMAPYVSLHELDQMIFPEMHELRVVFSGIVGTRRNAWFRTNVTEEFISDTEFPRVIASMAADSLANLVQQPA